MFASLVEHEKMRKQEIQILREHKAFGMKRFRHV